MPEQTEPCGMCGRHDCPTPVSREWLEAQGMTIAQEMSPTTEAPDAAE